jgi:hypothetical protein
MDNYLGRRVAAPGTLLTVGGQYDLSIGRLVSYPVPFSGDGPDLFVSLFWHADPRVEHGQEHVDPSQTAAKYDKSPSASSASRQPTACFPGWRLRRALTAWIPTWTTRATASRCFRRGSFSTLAGNPLISSCCSTHTGSTAASPRCGWASRQSRTSRWFRTATWFRCPRACGGEDHDPGKAYRGELLQHGLLAGLCTLAACIPNAGKSGSGRTDGVSVSSQRRRAILIQGLPTDRRLCRGRGGLEFFAAFPLPTSSSQATTRRHRHQSESQQVEGAVGKYMYSYTDATAQVYANRDGIQAPAGFEPIATDCQRVQL